MDRSGPSPSSGPNPDPTFHPAADAAGAGSITKLISGILDDSTSLIRQQLVMLGAEVKEDVTRTVAAGKYLGVGVFLLLTGLFFVLLGVPPLLHHLFPDLPLWACWMIVGTVILVAGVIALLIGRSLLSKFNPLPDKTLNALSENMSWITKRPS